MRVKKLPTRYTIRKVESWKWVKKFHSNLTECGIVEVVFVCKKEQEDKLVRVWRKMSYQEFIYDRGRGYFMYQEGVK